MEPIVDNNYDLSRALKTQALIIPTLVSQHTSIENLKLRRPIKPSRNKEGVTSTARKLQSFSEYHGKLIHNYFIYSTYMIYLLILCY